MTKKCQHIIAGILFLMVAIFVAQQDTSKTNHPTPTKAIPIDTTLLFQKVVLPNRLVQFRQYLQQYHLRVEDNYELLLLLSNPNTRQQLHHHFQMDTSTLLRHAELADLMQIGMTELDAQILLFSQRNYQNPFTGSTIHLQILAEADAESLLQDMGGWMAAKENALLQNYCLSIEDIESWIYQAKNQKYKIFAQIL